MENVLDLLTVNVLKTIINNTNLISNNSKM